MPRLARLDAPGVLHHIMIRGIERRKIFLNEGDYEDFVKRLAILLPEMKTACYAWVLLPNHAHFLFCTGAALLARLMRRLLTGYAVSFKPATQTSWAPFSEPVQIHYLPGRRLICWSWYAILWTCLFLTERTTAPTLSWATTPTCSSLLRHTKGGPSFTAWEASCGMRACSARTEAPSIGSSWVDPRPGSSRPSPSGSGRPGPHRNLVPVCRNHPNYVNVAELVQVRIQLPA